MQERRHEQEKDFLQTRVASMERSLDEARNVFQAHITNLEYELGEAKNVVLQKTDEIEKKNFELNAIYNSRSWRLVQKLKKIKALLFFLKSAKIQKYAKNRKRKH